MRQTTRNFKPNSLMHVVNDDEITLEASYDETESMLEDEMIVPARGTPDEIVRPQSPLALQHYQQQAIEGISPFNHDECLVSENLQQMSAQEDKVRVPTFSHVRPLSSRVDYLSTNLHNMSQQINDLSYTIHASIP
ncbi:hypothetical protein Tco_1025712 [Tanacetum coccineum]